MNGGGIPMELHAIGIPTSSPIIMRAGGESNFQAPFGASDFKPGPATHAPFGKPHIS
jgi:hypothetical protein